MAHWRDGGIGNMPGSDDRPIEEWTLLEKLAFIASVPIPEDADPETKMARRMVSDAFDEIQRLREAVEPAVRIITADEWRPIDTAPVEPGHTVPSYYRFRCLLQDGRDEVFEGAAYYVKVGRATTHPTLRWQNAMQRQCFPKFWKPLPAPKVTA